MSTTVAVIGGGNLGVAIAEGLISSGFIPARELIVTKRNTESLANLAGQGVTITNDNLAAVRQASWLIFAVKPFQIKEILATLQPVLDPGRHVIVSVMTGVWLHDLRGMLGEGFSLFRAMPNTAIAIRESMTCICADGASDGQVDYVQALFGQLGKTVFIDEKLMDAATVLGACGTAYAMRYIRANIQGGIEIGFDARTAALIAAQTVKGAAELLLTRNTHPEQEIDKVTTPKGCTIAGLNEMEHQGFSSSLIRGVVTSYKKIQSDM
ncbi:pyrroline-5-carboxylate reductase [Taibaiella koreensis]|uniref:pyrroline-5-carboxylate reductase n=1 Tax=Taibaiella koreensis TaxID=1268548 RepID=UPI000E59BB8B|nr:pyrroline-5-carboxylate reductase [Taibaiella koreensis]